MRKILCTLVTLFGVFSLSAQVVVTETKVIHQPPTRVVTVSPVLKPIPVPAGTVVVKETKIKHKHGKHKKGKHTKKVKRAVLLPPR